MTLRSFAWVVVGIGVMAAGSAACSSSSSPAQTPCNENPWECPAGQTCWPQDLAGNFQCLNAGAAKEGEACSNTVGMPSCADGMACLQLGGSSGGFCAKYCDRTNPTHACGAGASCGTITLIGTTASFMACIPTTQPDAGSDATDTGADAQDTGADAADASEAATETGADASDTGVDAGETGDAASGG